MNCSKEMSITEKKVGVAPEDVGYNVSQLEILDEHLSKLISKRRIEGASYLVSKDNHVFVQKSIDYLPDNKNDKQLLPDSIRKIASISKIFVAVSILQLVEKGKIRLDQCVSEIIEEFGKPMFEKITIFHLLTHTSGIRPDPGAFFEPYPLDWYFLESKNWIKRVLSDYLAVEPGKEWRYSSAGFTILSEIISRTSGAHFEKYVIENIARPLGMLDTYFDVPNEKIHRVYFANEREEKWFNESNGNSKLFAPRGSGGIFSTLEDIYKLGQMLINKGSLNGVRILSRKTVEAMTRNQIKGIKTYCWAAGGVEMEYGLGMNVYSNNTFLSPNSFSHEGAGLCGLYLDPVENVVLVYFCPLGIDVAWEAEAVINLRNIVWAGL